MRRWWVAAVVLAWLTSRAVVVVLLQGRHAWVEGDLLYYAGSLGRLDENGLAATLVEYPVPGVAVVALPWALARALGDAGLYGEVVVVLSLLADAAFTALLAAVAVRRRTAAVVVWLLAVPALGATAYARFDLVPGLLAATALLLLARHPRTAAALAALATGLKLWPALLLPPLAARAEHRRTVLAVVATVGVALAGVSLLLAGWARLVSPLAWQAERGLQIESVAATPAMVGWALSPAAFEVTLTEHHAYEVTGAGTALLLTVSEATSLLVLPALVLLWVLAFRHGRTLTTDAVAWICLASVGLFVVTSKVLSPQYLLWLLPLAAAAVGLVRGRVVLAWTALLLLAAACTQLVFPELYGELTHQGPRAGWAVLALTARNVLLVVLTGWACLEAVRGVSAAARSSASHPARTGTSSAPSVAERPTPT